MVTKTEMKQGNILIVDDELQVRRTLALMLQKSGYTVTEAATISEANNKLTQNTFALAIIDLRIGSESGIDLIRMIRKQYQETESILLTAYGTIESSVEVMQAGAFDYITKPFTNHELLIRVGKAVERCQMKQELITLRQHVAMNYGFDNIVGISKKLEIVKDTARRVAPTEITVLITGASGTGKELFARAIHHHSTHRAGKLIAIDCSAIPEALLESELFGHTKGSFTSANKNRIGLLEEADGGTIFLDEVSNMPQSIQVKLLRFLQDSVVRQIGSSESRKVNVRIVAASNRDLGVMVREGTFREDLYYRLNVIPLNLPTLSERSEDIEILTDYFIRKIISEMDRPPMSISRSAVEKLRTHNWPGNIRELENTLKRACALCTSDSLDAEDIMFLSDDRIHLADNTVNKTKMSLHLKGNLLDDSQRSLIIKALDDNSWNYTKTATELGIGRTTLWRKIKKYELQKETMTV